MGRRMIMSQRAIAGAVAKLNAENRDSVSELEYSETMTSLLMVQIFGQRNLPYIPPHIQRQKLADKLSPPPAKNASPTKSPNDATRHQSKPYGRNHYGRAFGMA